MKSIALVNSLEIKNSMSYTVTGITLTSRQSQVHNRLLFVVSLVPIY